MTATETIDRAGPALARSALYGAAAAMFRRPDAGQFRCFAEEEEERALCEAGAQSGIAGGLEAEAAGLRAAANASGLPALRAAFRQLFGNTSRGPVPPYETEYGGGGPFYQPQELGDINGFYRAFGVAVDPDRHERCDHFSCECEFMCFLLAREAYAIEHGDESAAETAAQAQRHFLRDHLGRFARTFLHRVEQQAPASWHAAAARFALTFIDAELDRLGVAVDRAYLPLRPVDDFDVPMACGSCSLPCGETPQSGE